VEEVTQQTGELIPPQIRQIIQQRKMTTMSDQTEGDINNRFYVEMGSNYVWNIIDRKCMYPSNLHGLSNVLAVTKDPRLAVIMCKALNDHNESNVKT